MLSVNNLVREAKKTYRVTFRYFFPVEFSGKGNKMPSVRNEGDVELKSTLKKISDYRFLIPMGS